MVEPEKKSPNEWKWERVENWGYRCNMKKENNGQFLVTTTELQTNQRLL